MAGESQNNDDHNMDEDYIENEVSQQEFEFSFPRDAFGKIVE